MSTFSLIVSQCHDNNSLSDQDVCLVQIIYIKLQHCEETDLVPRVTNSPVASLDQSTATIDTDVETI
jgi:hypothetical protein